MTLLRIADHKTFCVDGNDFLYLPRENAVFMMDDAVKSFIDHYAADSEGLSRDVDLLERDPLSPDREFFSDLAARHVIVPSDCPACHGGLQSSPPLKTLVLHVTDACNLNCLYCYRDRERPKEASMSEETAKRAVDMLLDRSGELSEVVLVFFGGEPLLEFKLIRSIVAYAETRGKSCGKKVNFAITTNGVLLTEATAVFLHDHDVGITISMDGPKHVHDRYRRFPGGGSTYEAILPHILTLPAIPRRKPVVARATVVSDPESVPESLDHLLDLGFSEAGFAPVTSEDEVHRLDEDGMDRLLTRFEALAEKFLETALAGKFYGFTNLIDLLVSLHEGEVKTHPCGAALGMLSISPEGELYPCQRLTGNREFLMGNLDDGIDETKCEAFRSNGEISGKSTCQSCWVRTLCAGGCYHEALVRRGDVMLPNLHYCRWIKRWIRIGLEIYGKLALSDPDYLDKLSMLRGHEPLFPNMV